jgi:hypothetical protein
MSGPRCCNKIRCCRQVWAGYTTNILENQLAYETTCEEYESNGLPDAIHVKVEGCPEFDVDCSLVKSEEDEFTYVSDDCPQCVALRVSSVAGGGFGGDPVLVEPGTEVLDGTEINPCAGSPPPVTSVLVVPFVDAFRVFPVGVLTGRCDTPFVYGGNVEPDDVVWAPGDTWSCEPPFYLPIHLDEWKKNPCHLVLLPSRSGIPFPGRLPLINPGTCENQCYDYDNGYDCGPRPPEAGDPAACCTDFTHYCLHVARVNGEFHLRSHGASPSLIYYDYGPAICSCAQCCPTVTLAWEGIT